MRYYFEINTLKKPGYLAGYINAKTHVSAKWKIFKRYFRFPLVLDQTE
jgi:hypothetical protein